MKDYRNYSLKEHNTFGIDARCSRFLEYESEDEAKQVTEILRTEAIPYIIIGGGSNLLLTKNFDGIVVHSAIKGFEVEGSQIKCGSGETWDDAVEFSLTKGLYGAENLSLIPGDVGASVVQNIGAYGVEAKDFIKKVWAIEIATGEVKIFTNEECQYAYRQSRFKQDWKNCYLITRVAYEFDPVFRSRLDYGNIRLELECRGIHEPTPQQLRQVIIDIRNAKLPDPKVMGNAGSFFMNPVVSRSRFEQLISQYPNMPHYRVDAEHEKIPAGWMIEQCGWKGKAMGRAGVHDRQALVLVNLGGATGSEIVALCHAIQKDVKQKFDIEIYPEVNVI